MKLGLGKTTPVNGRYNFAGFTGLCPVGIPVERGNVLARLEMQTLLAQDAPFQPAAKRFLVLKLFPHLGRNLLRKVVFLRRRNNVNV